MRVRVFLGVRRRSLLAGTMMLTLAAALSGMFEPLHRLACGVRPGVSLEGLPVGGMWPREVVALVDEFARREFRRPVDAGIDKQTGKVVPEKWGLAIDRQATVRAVLRARWRETVTAARVPVRPRYLTRDIEALTVTRGSFVTWVSGSPERVHNIRLAAGLVNRTLLYPGDVFSFNAVVGPRVADRGFLPAPTISEGRVVDDEGGGICQLATTIYNAALRAGMTVVERHPHSRPVSYVPPGMDATVSYEGLDLRFANCTGYPVVVLAWLAGSRLGVSVVGGAGST